MYKWQLTPRKEKKIDLNQGSHSFRAQQEASTTYLGLSSISHAIFVRPLIQEAIKALNVDNIREKEKEKETRGFWYDL